MYFNVIGAGRLGKAIAFALINSAKAELIAVCNARFSSAKEAVAQLGSGIAVAKLADLPPVDLTLITTSDDVISHLAQQLAQENIIQPQSMVIHCSGVLTAEVLDPLRALGCRLASLHPLKAFRGGLLESAVFQACDCIIEGDEEALQVLSPLFRNLGARMISIKGESKIIYHTAAVIASNYLVTLASVAVELFNEAGISEDLAKEMTTHLMASSLGNLQQTEHIRDALTGPLQRGDLETLSKHIAVLSKSTTKALYTSAALATLPLTNLSQELQKEIITRLTNPFTQDHSSLPTSEACPRDVAGEVKLNCLDD